MLCLISYDLKSSTKDYTALFEAIKSLGCWWHYLNSVWVVKTNVSVTTIVDRIKEVVEDADNIFVVDISGRDRNGWLPSKAWDWLRTNDEPKTGHNTSNCT